MKSHAVILPGALIVLASLLEPSASSRDRTGRLNQEALEALSLLAAAGREGLDPADYDAAELQRIASLLERGGAPSTDLAAFDERLTATVARYLHDLHEGRVDPRALGFRMNAPPDGHDFAALVRAAVADHRLAALAEAFTPHLALYRNLRSALARYRLLAADADPASVPAGPSVRRGDVYPAAQILKRRLEAFGDLPEDNSMTVAVSPLYAGSLVDGVTRFQRRHGLDPDGVLGPSTQAALKVPLTWRVRQIELALERLRWLPHLEDERFVAVNIPMFRLATWNAVRPEGLPSFQSGVIVGRALNTRTPVFVEEMRYIVFRPYWNVPSSILRHEILPAIARQPDYLERHDMEVVSGPGRPLRVRQRPGPANALGLVKFVFPNDDDVYMHGTPAPALFGRARRDFSHGCVRLEDPVGLAEWALADQPEWTRDRILEAMNGPTSQRIELSRPIRVVLFYLTAVVTPEDGEIHFAEDIYGHDARLDQMLRTGPRRLSGSSPH
jgi:murein L,D-transpeptidase YcbB/YkuD